MSVSIRALSPSIALCACPAVALAHQETGVATGFISGFLHPLFGLDHVVAMVAVGLLGAVMGPPAICVNTEGQTEPVARRISPWTSDAAIAPRRKRGTSVTRLSEV